MALPSPTVSEPTCQKNWDFLAAQIYSGKGDPETAVKARVGSLYLRSDGGAATSLYVKEADDGAATGWVAK